MSVTMPNTLSFRLPGPRAYGRGAARGIVARRAVALPVTRMPQAGFKMIRRTATSVAPAQPDIPYGYSQGVKRGFKMLRYQTAYVPAMSQSMAMGLGAGLEDLGALDGFSLKKLVKKATKPLAKLHFKATKTILGKKLGFKVASMTTPLGLKAKDIGLKGEEAKKFRKYQKKGAIAGAIVGAIVGLYFLGPLALAAISKAGALKGAAWSLGTSAAKFAAQKAMAARKAKGQDPQGVTAEEIEAQAQAMQSNLQTAYANYTVQSQAAGQSPVSFDQFKGDVISQAEREATAPEAAATATATETPAPGEKKSILPWLLLALPFI